MIILLLDGRRKLSTSLSNAHWAQIHWDANNIGFHLALETLHLLLPPLLAKITKSRRCLQIIRKSTTEQMGYSEGLRIYERMGKPAAVLCRRRVMTCRGRKSRKQMSYFPSPRKQAGHAWQSLSVGRTLHSSSEVASKISHQCSIQNSGSQIAKISFSTISNSPNEGKSKTLVVFNWADDNFALKSSSLSNLHVEIEMWDVKQVRSRVINGQFVWIWKGGNGPKKEMEKLEYVSTTLSCVQVTYKT